MDGAAASECTSARAKPPSHHRVFSVPSRVRLACSTSNCVCRALPSIRRSRVAVASFLPLPERFPSITTLPDVSAHECLLPVLLMSSVVRAGLACHMLVSSRAQVKRGTGAGAMIMEPRGVGFGLLVLSTTYDTIRHGHPSSPVLARRRLVGSQSQRANAIETVISWALVCRFFVPTPDSSSCFLGCREYFK